MMNCFEELVGLVPKSRWGMLEVQYRPWAKPTHLFRAYATWDVPKKLRKSSFWGGSYRWEEAFGPTQEDALHALEAKMITRGDR